MPPVSGRAKLDYYDVRMCVCVGSDSFSPGFSEIDDHRRTALTGNTRVCIGFNAANGSGSILYELKCDTL